MMEFARIGEVPFLRQFLWLTSAPSVDVFRVYNTPEDNNR